jgi:hypothetical protein
MSHQDHFPQHLLDVAPLPARPLRNQPRRGWGTIFGFAISFLVILVVTMAGVGLPTPIKLPPAQPSDQR